MQQALKSLYGPDIRKQAQFLTHSQQSLFRTHFSCRIVVELRITYSREKNGIRSFTNLICFFRERISHLVDSIGPAKSIFITDFMSEFLTNGTHHLHTLCSNFRTDPVTGKYSYIQFHIINDLLVGKFSYSLLK